MDPKWRFPILIAVLLSVSVAGCGAGVEEEDAGEPASAEATVATDATTTTEATVEEDAVPVEAPEGPLPDDWYEDPDGDLIPTAVENEIDTDPERIDCLADLSCPGVDVDLTELGEGENTLLILDSSGSMAGDAGGEKKIEAARDALQFYATATPDRYELGFMVYGHEGSNDAADKAESCAGTELLEPIGDVDYRTFGDTLASFEPTGFTPIARSLEEARDAFAGREGESNRVILVSDGKETCGGDPVAAARSLKQSGIEVTVDVVGFDVAEGSEAESLRQVAEVTGGRYTAADTGDELQGYLEAEASRITQENAATACLITNENEFSACQITNTNAATAFMITRQNELEADSITRENEISASMIQEENAASAAGDTERADELSAERQAIVGELEAERKAVVGAIQSLREPLDESDAAIRARFSERFQELRAQIVEESREVRKRIEEVYGPDALTSFVPARCPDEPRLVSRARRAADPSEPL